MGSPGRTSGVIQVEHQVVGLVPRPAEDEEESDRCQSLDDIRARPSHALISLRFFAFIHKPDAMCDALPLTYILKTNILRMKANSRCSEMT